MNYNFNELFNVINQNNTRTNNINFNKVKESIIYRNINDCINNCKRIYVDKILNETLLKIHRNNEYPLMYLIFKKLKQFDKIKHLFKFVVNLDNYNDFLQWYREHHHLINTSWKVLRKKHYQSILENNKRIIILMTHSFFYCLQTSCGKLYSCFAK